MIDEIARLPDISFIDGVTLDGIKADLASDYESKYKDITGETVTLKDGEPIKLMLDACAVQLMQMYGALDVAGKMNFLKYAYEDYLDNLAALKGVERQGGTAAICTARFTLSAIRASVVSIPQGTRITTGTADLYFQTDEYAEIPVGSEYVDVTCTAMQVGAIGNGLPVDTLSVIVDPVPYVASVSNITATSGGVDLESDDSLRDRVYLAPANYSVAGPEKAYVYFVKTAYPAAADVRVTSPDPTEIDIRVVGEGGEALSQDVLDMIEDYLETMGVRPLTDEVSVSNPTASTYNITMTYYINKSDSVSAAGIQTQVEAAVDSYIKWQSEKIGRDIEPGKLVQLCMAAGAKRVVVTYPVRTVVADTAIPVLGTKAVTYGGLEDD